MSTIRIAPRRTTRKTTPLPIYITDDQVIRPGNSGSTLGSPPRRDYDKSSEEHANKILALEVARQGLPGRAPGRQPYMFTNPHNMCYRNSALAMLLNIEPFLGWLRLHGQVSPAGKEGAPETIMSYLEKMAQVYWLSENASGRALDRAMDRDIMRSFWAEVIGRWEWGTSDTQEDASEFLDHIWGQAKSEVVPGPANDVLDALVSTVKLPRIVSGRGCEHTKVRETDRPFEQNQQGLLFNVLVNSNSPRTLKACIENALHDDASTNDLCIICEEEFMPGHRFYKFRALPEVLIISISRYEVRPGVPQAEAEISHARCEIPDTLDLSEFLEDENQSRDQIAIYQYTAAVFHQGRSMKSGHYVAHARNKDGNFFLLDDMARPRVQSSSMKAINNAPKLDVTLVAFVKMHKRTQVKSPDADAEERVLTWWRKHMPVAPGIPGSSFDDPANQPTNPESSMRKPGLQQPNPHKKEPPEQDSLMPDYSDKDEKQLKSLMKQRALVLDNKKHPLSWYIDKLLRHNANATTYEEYTFQELKKEIAWRGLDLKNIKNKAAAAGQLEKDDKETGCKGKSTGSIKRDQQTKRRPGNAESELERLVSRKPGRLSGVKESSSARNKQPTKMDGISGNNVIKKAADVPTTQDLDIDPPSNHRTNLGRFTISTTLQILGKGSEPGPEPLNHTWLLPATYDPQFDLKVICSLTITTPDGQKNQFPISISSERDIFHLDSWPIAQKKRKTHPPSHNSGEQPNPPKRHRPSPPDSNDNGPKSSQTKPLKKTRKLPRKGEGKDMAPSEDLAIEGIVKKASSALRRRTTVSLNLLPPRAGSTLSPPTSDRGSLPSRRPCKPAVRKSSTREPRGSNSPARLINSGSTLKQSKAPPKPMAPKKSRTPQAKGEYKARIRKFGSGPLLPKGSKARVKIF